MKSIVAFITAALLATSGSAATQCPKGQGPDSNGVCDWCPAGYYNDQDAGVCQPAQPGWYACRPGTLTCAGAEQQTQCGAGKYSVGYGNASCQDCPAGNICPSATTSQPQPCSPGQYMDVSGSGDNRCKSCGVGTFNDENGATGCCKCCAGTYNDQVSQTHCFYCGEHTNPTALYSPVGATSVNQCQTTPINGVTNAPHYTCDVTHPTNFAQGQCPAEQGTAPSQGVQPARRRSVQCGHGLKKCPLYSGKGGFDCVDTKNDPEQCGGCVSIDGVPSTFNGEEGTDCTAIPSVSMVNCVKGKCIIETCRKGFAKSADGKSCVSSSGLNVQQHSDSAKRNAHGRRWHVTHSEN